MAKRPAPAPMVYRYTVDDVRYDPVTHTSTLPDGQKVPHVTEVLQEVGVTRDFDELAAISVGVGDSIEKARLRGTAIHADCHAYDDDGDLLWDTVHHEVKPYVSAWAQCREDMGLVPIAHARERRIYHPLFHYTGILDGVFMRGDLRILLDLKGGDPECAAAHLQTAGYEGAWVTQFPHLPIDERWAVQLTPKLKVPYRIKNYTDPVKRPDHRADFGKWLACLTVYNEQPARRKKVA